MGQLTLLSVLGAFLIGGVVIFNANRSADEADEQVWEHQYQVVARDAAATGMATAMRTLTNAFEANTAWNGALATILSQTSAAYDGGTYIVAAAATPDAPGSSACPLLSVAEYEQAMTDPDGGRYVPQGDIMTVTTTGTYQGSVGGNVNQRHQIRACYLKADYGLFAPPAFNYGFISNDDFTFNGGPQIQALVDGEGHVHSNADMTLGPQVEIDGYVTYTGSHSINTTQIAGHSQGPHVPIEPFDADEFAADNGITADYCAANPNQCRYSTGYSGNPTTIAPATCSSTNCADDPFIWFIDGNFDLSGGQNVTIPQYTTIVVTGDITVGGGSSVTVSGESLAAYCARIRGRSCNQNQMEAYSRDWVLSQLFDGVHSPLAWYGEGSVTLNGTPGIVGNFYVNGDVTLNGGGGGNNTVGSFASALGTITSNGGGNGNNFWFLEVYEQNVIDGVRLPGKQIVRLALAEWTDPVLDN